LPLHFRVRQINTSAEIGGRSAGEHAVAGVRRGGPSGHSGVADRLYGSGAGIISDEDLSLILGNNALLKEAGLKLEYLPDEGYYIRYYGNRIFLAGRDAEESSPGQNGWGQYYMRGMLLASL